MKSSVLLLVAVCTALSTLASTTHAQSWPSRPARIIVPFAPGGGSDLQGRLFAKKFTESMGQSFLVENRGGAGGMVGAELVAKAPPDGYTILFMSAALSVNTTLAKLGFNPLKDLAPGEPRLVGPAHPRRAPERSGEERQASSSPSRNATRGSSMRLRTAAERRAISRSRC